MSCCYAKNSISISILRLTEKQAAQLGIVKNKTKLSELQAKNKALLKQQGRGLEPQAILSLACKQKWPMCIEEYPNSVPGRKYLLDIAFPDHKLAVERIWMAVAWKIFR